MKKFKFFNKVITKIDWQQTGLLEDAVNFVLLGQVLDLTYDYINDDNVTIDDDRASMLIIIMTRLFRDKTMVRSYMNDFVVDKLIEVVTFMNSPRINSYIIDIQQNAWTGIDVEAEITQLVVTTCN